MPDIGLGVFPQMVLGGFVFELNTAIFREMQRETAYRWASQDRCGQHPVLQFLGAGEDTISLPGVVYPAYRGGTGQLDTLRDVASAGLPVALITGGGDVLGRWVIEAISETRSNLAAAAVPLKQEFTVKLRHFDGGTYDDAVNLLNAMYF